MRAFVLVVGCAMVAQADDLSPIPYAQPNARYQKMMEVCPFAIATPVAPAAEPQAGFAGNWFVSGIARLDGEDFVTIKARDLSTEFSLFGHDANSQNGVQLASVEWSDKIGKSIVIIKKGTETAKLEFNEAEMQAAPKATPTAAGPGAFKNNAPPIAVGNKPAVTPLFKSTPEAQFPATLGITPKPGTFLSGGKLNAPGSFLPGQNRGRATVIKTPQQQ